MEKSPLSNYTSLTSADFAFTRNIVSLVCNNKHCDKDILSRWFATVRSILHTSDVEVLWALRSRPYLSLVVRRNYYVSLKIRAQIICNDDADDEGNVLSVYLDTVLVPTIVGSQLWFMCAELAIGTEIDAVNFKNWRDDQICDNLKSTKTKKVYCPTCSFEKYIPLGCFVIGKKLTRLPIFAFVDAQKIHYNRRLKCLSAYKHNVSLQIPECLRTISDVVSEWCDYFSNYSLYTPTCVFMRLICDVADSMFDPLKCENITYSFDANQIALPESVTYCRLRIFTDSKQLPLSKMRSRLVIRGIELSAYIAVGNVTMAVSKNTRFKTTDMGGQSHETDAVAGATQHDAVLAKSDYETRRGYYRASSRYLQTSPNSPTQLLYAPLHVTKLVSGQVLTNSHQSLHTTSLNYVCAMHTIDNKNAGMHLELLPGTVFVNTFQCFSNDDTLISAIRTSSEWLVSTFPKIQRECCTCQPLYAIKHEDTFVMDMISSIAQKSQVNKCVCKTDIKRRSSQTTCFLTLVDSQMREHWLSCDAPRLDLVILAVIYSSHVILSNTPPIKAVDVYFNRFCKVGIVRSVSNCLLDERFALTPTTRDWLLNQYSEAWTQLLSPSIDGNSILIGTLGTLVPLPGHSATAKTTAGLSGLRHASGLPTSVLQHSTQPTKSLLYSQNDLSRPQCLALPTQLAFVLITALGGDNVEDGIVVSKSARDRGFGMTQSTWTLSLKSLSAATGNGVNIWLPNENYSYRQALSHETLLRLEVDQSIDLFLDEWFTRRCIHEGSSLFDITGIACISSFSTNVQVKTVQSATRVIYVEPYGCGSKNGRLQICRICVTRKNSGNESALQRNRLNRKSKKIMKHTLSTDTGYERRRQADKRSHLNNHHNDCFRNLEKQSNSFKKFETNTPLPSLSPPLTSFANNIDFVVLVTFQETRLLELGDKYSTIDGQKSTVVSVAPEEDLPFFGKGRISENNACIPPRADVFYNVSMEKRQTIGLVIAANIRAAKCARPDTTDLTCLYGNKSLNEHSINEALQILRCDQLKTAHFNDDPVVHLISNAWDMRHVEVFDGRTGRFMGYGDLLTLPMCRYDQEGAKAAHYTAESEDILREPLGDYPNRGRGNLGGMKQSQTDTCNLQAAGAVPSHTVQLQRQGEPCLAIDSQDRGRILPSTKHVKNTFAFTGYDWNFV